MSVLFDDAVEILNRFHFTAIISRIYSISQQLLVFDDHISLPYRIDILRIDWKLTKEVPGRLKYKMVVMKRLNSVINRRSYVWLFHVVNSPQRFFVVSTLFIQTLGRSPQVSWTTGKLNIGGDFVNEFECTEGSYSIVTAVELWRITIAAKHHVNILKLYFCFVFLYGRIRIEFRCALSALFIPVEMEI